MDLISLPDEILMLIAQFLDWKSLIKFSEISSRVRPICLQDTFWIEKCKSVWLLNSMPPNEAELSFRDMYIKWGNHINHYARVRSIWDNIFDICERKMPLVYDSLLPGLLDCVVDEFELQFMDGFVFPDEVRCSLKICQGQEPFMGPGLLGCSLPGEAGLFLWALFGSLRDESMSSGCYASPGRRVPRGLSIGVQRGAAHHPLSVILCLDEQQYGKLAIRTITHRGDMINFIADSLVDYLENWVKMHNNGFMSIAGLNHAPMLNFYMCSKQTGAFLSEVWTCPLWTYSAVDNDFYYSYKIRISMDVDAPDCDSCRLDTRHWVCEHMEQGVICTHEVDGPGVVGEHPVLRPGTCYVWHSITNFPVPYGIMNGHFKMDRLNRMQPPINILCAPMHFEPTGYLQFVDSNRELPDDFKRPDLLFDS